jgi:lipoate synthase
MRALIATRVRKKELVPVAIDGAGKQEHWVRPETFDALAAAGHGMGIPHVEASPMTRSSYHAREAAAEANAS